MTFKTTPSVPEFRMPLTHKGWFGICPVYFGDIEGPEPTLIERMWVYEPLLWMSIGLFSIMNWSFTLVNPQHRPHWVLTVTGTLPAGWMHVSNGIDAWISKP